MAFPKSGQLPLQGMIFRLFLNFPDRINSYFIDPIPLMPQKNCRIVWYQDLGLYILLLA